MNAQLLLQGGWTMLALAACSVALTAIFLAKLLQLRALEGGLDFVARAIALAQDHAHPEAAALCRAQPHPVAPAFAHTFELLLRRPERAEAEAERAARAALDDLEAHLDWLGFICQAAPLLGLLGTAIGMVELFAGMSGARDVDMQVLSAGIWKALITTAAGLVVAVPALAGHTYLVQRVDRLRREVAEALGRALTESPRGRP